MRVVGLVGGAPSSWLHVYQQLQDDDIRAALGAWIDATSPRFGEDIAARFARLKSLDAAEVARCRALRESLAERVQSIVNQALTVLPTTPRALLRKDETPEQIGAFYRDALTMDSVAALAGLPQVTVPVLSEASRPLALSFIGPRNSDRALIARVRELFPHLT